MINLNYYISEKLHLNKNTGEIKSVQDIYNELDSFLYDELNADYHYCQLNRISDNHRKIQFSGTKTKGQEYGNKIKEYIKKYNFKYTIEDHVNDYMYILNIIVTDESIDDTYYVSEKLHINKNFKSIYDKESFIDAFTNAGCVCTDRGDYEFTIWCKEENKFPYMMLNLFNDFWTSYYVRALHVITNESENDDIIYSFDAFKKCPGCTTNKFEYSQYNFDILLEMLKENETV